MKPAGGATCTDWSTNRIYVREKIGFPAPPRAAPVPRRRRRTRPSMLSTARGGGNGSGRGASEKSLLTFRSLRFLQIPSIPVWRSIRDAGRAKFKAEQAKRNKAFANGAKHVVLHTALRNPNWRHSTMLSFNTLPLTTEVKTRCRARVQAVARRFWRWAFFHYVLPRPLYHTFAEEAAATVVHAIGPLLICVSFAR